MTPKTSAIRGRAGLLAIALTASLALAACGGVEENPLGVNTPADTSPGPGEAAMPEDGTRAAPVGADLGDDPLDIGLDGAELCGVQPDDSRLRYTVMLHNPTLETFTFGEMALGNPQDLDVISSMVQTANREGHHHPAAGDDAHEEHSAAPSPTASPEPIGPPEPAEGYQFVPDAHVNIIVTVELAEGATHGSADNILVAFSSPDRDYSVAHNLKIDVDATSCQG
ncbi:hypothetical protein FJV46_02370 [Arthrobacter agilis]|uniref:hypothetical protein n=1 Tax=Arthrobacter agilis TaxID=37921 RepID=UPI000B34EFF7|nr:hypothetical protein [Arthrobacter agilis]OUM40712.1 hypothetical protein B8W74_14605 [Arthrobacter agilis]PPB45320.1 hypothetical protein CI784_14635 [Arthrobacter agilis]TPV28029.1 hypothetical protein FJV46_02370 [Arthrobacter agilis]VDR31278.1 Uncharacterised protein [Arthrobacter agilis]